ncbi:MAG: HEAT repeat domain-containing protein [Elusimicrobia bacterium]|nr:HEAT repeat domain-containing protein [Elusimicrobiota bacterium]
MLAGGGCLGRLASAVESPEARRKALGARALGILQEATRDAEGDVRALAAEVFGAAGNAAAVPLLKRMLEDKDRFVRVAAAESLARLGDPDGVPSLERLAFDRPSEAAKGPMGALEELKALPRAQARAAAIRSLARLESRSSERVLRRARRDRIGVVRDAAGAALARLGDPDELRSFARGLADPDEGVRAAAAAALGEIARPQAIGALAAASRDASPQVRSSVLRALGAAASGASLAEGAAAMSSVRRGLRDESELVQAAAIEALGRSGLPGVGPVLRAAREEARSPYLQLLALDGLARLDKEIDLPLVERGLTQPDIDSRLLAIRVLESARTEGAVELLESALEHAEARVRVHAAAALVKRLARPPSGASGRVPAGAKPPQAALPGLAAPGGQTP